MSFFSRIIHYVFNEALVNALANSPTFQRFAIRSQAVVQDLTKKSAEHQQNITGQAAEFTKTFRDEMKKGLDEQFGKGGGRR